MDKRVDYNATGQTEAAQKSGNLSPWARYWARQHRLPQDSHLVSFGDRVTYTFAVGNDAASIHFDQARGKIFYKGHRVVAEDLQPGLVELLNHFKDVLAKSQYADRFLTDYEELLSKMHLTPSTPPKE